MDEERNKRPVKKVENPVREWISDNLRYIMLIGGIALVVIIAFVLFTVLGSKGGQDTASNKSDVKVTAEPSVTTATVLRLIVNRRASDGFSAIAIETRATPGV